ncbi:DNA translocase FtsK [Levilactobacillus enshiensis]|uniref:DNA translocase FtsK n=1 Tax=Levilactobacillus enshiensis TaxID=2590213 RepID=UPI00117AF2A2|nr:DNA translocase FtsK [Levilactobacillus enshiensis]
MEHYDGPAFYRKFPVEPTPEQLEDTTNERAQRQVKERKARNDRIRLREERQKQPLTSEKERTVMPTSTAQTQATSEKPTTSTGNYRPFQVTEIPKQLHWTRPTLESRRRYQRLIASLHKSDASFFLFGRAEDATRPTTTLNDAVQKTTIPTVDSKKTVVKHDLQPATSVSLTVTASHEAKVPVSLADTSVTPPVATVATLTAADPTVADDATSEAAPTEIFYPTASSVSAEPAAELEDKTAADKPESEAESTPEPTAKATSVSESDTDLTSVAEVTAERTTSKASENLAARTTELSATDAKTTAAPAKPVAETTYLPVGSAGDSASQRPSTVPVSETAPHDEQPKHPTDTAVDGADHPAEVAKLLARADADAPSEATSDSEAETVADHDVTDAEEGSEPAATNGDMTTSEATSSVVNNHAKNVAPAKPKAKPSRGLGHSLGDIMQEEGNDQRNLALFDRPTPATVESENEEPTDRGYHFPDLSLLPNPVVPDEEALDEWIEHQAEVLDATLSAFHVDAHVTDWTVGPTVTQFQISLALGVKVNKITNLNDDLKLALAAKDIRIEAPIPGKTTVGIEIPNLKSRPVMLSEILNSAAFKKSESPLTVALGVDLFGKPQVTDLRKMPHGLIAGATGSGKSVFINSLLLSILYKATPKQVKLLLIDPKAVEMAPYDALPHLLSPVISDPKAAAAALKWVVTEMDERYEKLAAAGVRNIEQFNDRADANDEPALKMPYIVIIIDELADLMMMAASEVQDYIVRITQKARAAGIHLLVATQRPSVDIVTGTIKNNIPTRIAFMVSSQIDSRTILDTAGAENLLGRGDMLYLGNGASQPMRLQGAFVESEVDAVTDFVRTQGQPHYAFEPKGLLQRETAEENQDELLPKVLDYIAQEKSVSTSKLQRVFSIGYNRAANLIDDLEQHHYVSPQHGSKPREVYLTPEDLGKKLPEPHDQSAPFSS